MLLQLGYESWGGWAAAAYTGWCAMRPGDECGNLLIHELGHSATMAHFTAADDSISWGIEDEYPNGGFSNVSLPWGYDSVSQRFRTWYYVVEETATGRYADVNGTAKRDPMNSGSYKTTESCFNQFVPYHARKMQNWAMSAPELLDSETATPVAPEPCGRTSSSSSSAVTETVLLSRQSLLSWTSDAAVTLVDSSAYFVAADSAIGPTSREWWGSSSTVVTVPLHSSCGGPAVTATFKAQQTACGSTWQMNAGRSAGSCDHQLVLTLDDDAAVNTWRTDTALDSCELRTLRGIPVMIEARQWHAPAANALLGELTVEVVVRANDCTRDPNWKPAAGVYLWNTATHQYDGPMTADVIRSTVKPTAQLPVQIGVPAITLIGTLATNLEACQTYPPTYTATGNTFVPADPFSSSGLPALYNNAAHYLKIIFQDGSSEFALLAVPHFESSDTSTKYYSINVAADRYPMSVELYATTSDVYPSITETSTVTLLHTRVIESNMELVSGVVRVGRGWLGGVFGVAQPIQIDASCVSGSDEHYGCQDLASSVEWRDAQKHIGLTYSVNRADTVISADASDAQSTALKIIVFRDNSTDEEQLLVMASRSYDNASRSLSESFPLIGSSAPAYSPEMEDEKQGVHFWVPYNGPNANVLAAGGVFRSTAPIVVQASDGSWNASISVNIRTRAVTETIELRRNETTITWTSDAAVTLVDSSAYFVAADSAIGPTSREWWGSSSTVVTVPLHSSCGGPAVTATFKAQQTACGSTWQMNAGRSAGSCDHQLVLTLDDDAAVNTWRTDTALDSCELRTLRGIPVMIEARQWHAPAANALLGELAIAITSPALTMLPPTSAPTATSVLTCGDLANTYQANSCCGNPNNPYPPMINGTCRDAKALYQENKCCPSKGGSPTKIILFPTA